MITLKNQDIKMNVLFAIIEDSYFDAYDLLNTLYNIKNNNIKIINEKMVNTLKQLKVIDFEGDNDNPATIGENFKEFYKELKLKIKEYEKNVGKCHNHFISLLR